MKQARALNIKWGLIPLMTCILYFYGCKKPVVPANLTINKIELIETNDIKYIDIPDGVYMPDHPDFSIGKPHTWTGNMAQYVKHNFFYTVNYQVSNLGGSIAYDSEIDLFYLYTNDNEEVATLKIGDISPNATINRSISVFCENKQMTECSAEIYWYE